MPRKKEEIFDVDELIGLWERAGWDPHPYYVAVRTAAALARVAEVPKSVIESLDLLLSDRYHDQASSVYEVVLFLRSLKALQRAIGPEAKPVLDRAKAKSKSR